MEVAIKNYTQVSNKRKKEIKLFEKNQEKKKFSKKSFEIIVNPDLCSYFKINDSELVSKLRDHCCYSNSFELYKKFKDLKLKGKRVEVIRGYRYINGEYEPSYHFWLEIDEKVWDIGKMNIQGEIGWYYMIYDLKKFYLQFRFKYVDYVDEKYFITSFDENF